MAYDEALAARIDAVLADEPGVAEKPMFGGLAFLVDGRLVVAASGQGGLMVRVDPARRDDLRHGAGVQPFLMRGREVDGWLRVDSAAVRDDHSLRQWVEVGLTYARSLPPS